MILSNHVLSDRMCKIAQKDDCKTISNNKNNSKSNCYSCFFETFLQFSKESIFVFSFNQKVHRNIIKNQKYLNKLLEFSLSYSDV